MADQLREESLGRGCGEGLMRVGRGDRGRVTRAMAGWGPEGGDRRGRDGGRAHGTVMRAVAAAAGRETLLWSLREGEQRGEERQEERRQQQDGEESTQ